MPFLCPQIGWNPFPHHLLFFQWFSSATAPPSLKRHCRSLKPTRVLELEPSFLEGSLITEWTLEAGMFDYHAGAVVTRSRVC